MKITNNFGKNTCMFSVTMQKRFENHHFDKFDSFSVNIRSLVCDLQRCNSYKLFELHIFYINCLNIILSQYEVVFPSITYHQLLLIKDKVYQNI